MAERRVVPQWAQENTSGSGERENCVRELGKKKSKER